MGARAAARSLKPQPDGKRETPKRKKTLKEVASEMKEDMKARAFEERRRQEETLREDDERELYKMIFGPSGEDDS